MDQGPGSANLPGEPEDGSRQGLRDEDPPVRSGIAAAIALGGMWGLLGYAVLWQGVPFAVDRSFVESLAGTVLLLPVRIVLWAIRSAEQHAGHPFAFSNSTSEWIALAASAAGALVALVAFVLIRGVIRASARRRSGP
jgi:ABC-type xylose transport system permease subunit